jgi:acetyl-CoA C-acetyltransferase
MTPGITLQRACGTSLDTVITIANKIAVGQIEAGIGGGSDTTSDVPIAVNKRLRRRLLDANMARSAGGRLRALKGFAFRELAPEFPGVGEPRTGKSMGEHCEQMAKEWAIERAAQDQLAYESHNKAAAAYERGFFADLVVPFRGVERDNILRPDTTVEKLAALKPAFDRTSGKGTLTAGNSTPLTDGASAALLSSDEWAKAHGREPLAYLVDAQVAAIDFVHGEGLLMAPAWAVAQLLARNGLTLQDFDFYEIHEAFAAQVLCTLKAWESPDFCRDKLGLDAPLGSVNRERLNVVGSSLAVGHPFAATGARIVATAAKLLKEKGGGRALISVCTAGGMGVTAILER